VHDDVSAGSSARSSVGGRDERRLWGGVVSISKLAVRLMQGVVAVEKASSCDSPVAFDGDRGLTSKCISVGASMSSKPRSSSEIDGGSTMPPVAKEAASFNPD
jgi:hypothetical protein